VLWRDPHGNVLVMPFVWYSARNSQSILSPRCLTNYKPNFMVQIYRLPHTFAMICWWRWWRCVAEWWRLITAPSWAPWIHLQFYGGTHIGCGMLCQQEVE